MADENRIATFEWLSQYFDEYEKIANPPKTKKGVRKDELIANYSVDESLLNNHNNNQLVKRSLCVGVTMLAYYPIDIEGAMDSDIQPTTGKLIVGGSTQIGVINRDQYIGMKYHTFNTTNGQPTGSTSLSKIIRLNKDLSIDSTFNLTGGGFGDLDSILGEVVSVECFENGNIAIRTRNGLNSVNNYRYGLELLYILSPNGKIINFYWCHLSRMNRDRTRLLIYESQIPTQPLTYPKSIYIIDSVGNKISSNYYTGTTTNSIMSINFAVDIISYTTNGTNADNFHMYVFDIRNLNNPVHIKTYDVSNFNNITGTKTRIIENSYLSTSQNIYLRNSSLTTSFDIIRSGLPTIGVHKAFQFKLINGNYVQDTVSSYTAHESGTEMKYPTKSLGYLSIPFWIIETPLSIKSTGYNNDLLFGNTSINYDFNKLNIASITDNTFVLMTSQQQSGGWVKLGNTYIKNFAIYKNNSTPVTSY